LISLLRGPISDPRGPISRRHGLISYRRGPISLRRGPISLRPPRSTHIRRPFGPSAGPKITKISGLHIS